MNAAATLEMEIRGWERPQIEGNQGAIIASLAGKIRDLLERGFERTCIYKAMCAAGLISIRRGTFTSYLGKALKSLGMAPAESACQKRIEPEAELRPEPEAWPEARPVLMTQSQRERAARFPAFPWYGQIRRGAWKIVDRESRMAGDSRPSCVVLETAEGRTAWRIAMRLFELHAGHGAKLRLRITRGGVATKAEKNGLGEADAYLFQLLGEINAPVDDLQGTALDLLMAGHDPHWKSRGTVQAHLANVRRDVRRALRTLRGE